VDALVEFCRTGVLGHLRKGVNATEVERVLGAPEDVKHLHGDENWQRYRYGSLSMVLMCLPGEQPDKVHLRVHSIAVSFKRLPLDLPEPIVQGLAYEWNSSRAEDLLRALRQAGIDVAPKHEASTHGLLHQEYRAGSHPVVITAFDGQVSVVEAA
jgi:hypothetical protein